jgi:hypothetical protein
MTDDDGGTVTDEPVTERDVPARATADDGPGPEWRAALVELARLAAVAPAMAVLLDPERARAAS